MIRNEVVTAILVELGRHQLADGPAVSNGGKHYKVRWRVPGGPPRTATAPCTPSDRRSTINGKAFVRRLLRQDGAELRPTRRRRTRVSRPKPVTASNGTSTTAPKPVVIPIRMKIADPKPIRTISQEHLTPTHQQIWQALTYDRPIKLTVLAVTLGKGRATVSVHLHQMKVRGLVRNLSERRGWIRNPLP